MTHNITGSEVGHHRPIAYLSQLPRRRRRAAIDQLIRLHPAVWLHLAMIPLGIVIGLVDALVIGKPFVIVLAMAAMAAWRFWPADR